MKKSLLLSFAAVALFAACNSSDSSGNDETTAKDTAATVMPPPQPEPATVEVTIPEHITAAVAKAKPITKKPHHAKVTKKVKKSDGVEVERTGVVIVYEFVPDLDAPPTPPPAATPKEDRPKDAESFHYYPDKPPTFPGGDKALHEYLEKNIVYPNDALDNNIQGTVLLRFAVDETGKVYTPKVISKKLGYGLEDEAIRIVEKMPKWNPGTIRNEVVKTRYTLPVRFTLADQ